MPIFSNKHSNLRMATATILLSANTAIADDFSGEFSTPLTRAQFQTRDYNHICPLAVYNEDYRGVQDAKTSDAIAGQFQNKQTKPTQSLEASNG